MTLPRIGIEATLIVAAVAFEAFGISLLIPVMESIEQGGSLADRSDKFGYWHYVELVYGFFGIPITLLSLLICIFLFVLMRQVMRYIQVMSISRLKQHVERALMQDLFVGGMQSNPRLLQELSAGKFTYVVNTLADGTATLLRGYGTYLTSVILCVIYLAVAIPTAPIPAVFAIVVALIVMRGVQRLSNMVRVVSTKGVEIRQNFQNHLSERYRNWRLIKLADTVTAETSMIRKWAQRIFVNDLEVTRLSSLNDVVIVPVMSFLTLGTLYVSVEIFEIKISEIMLLIFIMIRLEPVVRNFARQRQSMARFTPQMEECYKYLDDFLADREPDNGTQVLEQCGATIEYRNVSFAYEETSDKAIEDISLTIPAGTMTAIIGPSGAGKSTLVDLLPRIIRPQSGSILIDGIDINEFTLSSLRRNIAFVGQKEVLFNQTVAENIRYGQSELSDEDIVAAARKAYAHEFIVNLPEGYDTRIGEGGARLSGGQQQRLALARAFASKALILVLDEPTSALDYESESMIKSAIENIRQNQMITIIIIAHRLSTVSAADEIVVITDGRIADVGQPADLVKKSGWYKKMIELNSSSHE